MSTDESSNNQTNSNSLSNSLQPLIELFKFESIEELKVPVNPNETGWDRLKNTWLSFHRGEDNIESKIIMNSLGMGGLFGFTLGAITKNRDVFSSFIQKHNANVFHGKYKANRLLVDTMYLELFKRSIKHSIRYGLFAGSFVSMMTLCATYRNDIYYRDCALAGAITGVVWKMHLGFRAALVNATLGSLFGLTFAAMMRLAMKLSGSSIRQMRYVYQYEYTEKNIR